MWYKTARVFAVLLVIFFILWMFSFLSFISLLHLGPTEDSVLITELNSNRFDSWHDGDDDRNRVYHFDWMARGTPPI
jgi:hypothetical protein